MLLLHKLALPIMQVSLKVAVALKRAHTSFDWTREEMDLVLGGHTNFLPLYCTFLLSLDGRLFTVKCGDVLEIATGNWTEGILNHPMNQAGLNKKERNRNR